jgi:hypothetical protein
MPPLNALLASLPCAATQDSPVQQLATALMQSHLERMEQFGAASCGDNDNTSAPRGSRLRNQRQERARTVVGAEFGDVQNIAVEQDQPAVAGGLQE